MNTIRRGLKRKDPEKEEEYQAGLNQFQVPTCPTSILFRVYSAYHLKINVLTTPCMLSERAPRKYPLYRLKCCSGGGEEERINTLEIAAYQRPRSFGKGNTKQDQSRRICLPGTIRSNSIRSYVYL